MADQSAAAETVGEFAGRQAFSREIAQQSHEVKRLSGRIRTLEQAVADGLSMPLRWEGDDA